MLTVDIQQWIATLKEAMPAKTVSRKVSAAGNYFRWLDAEKCEQLLKTASVDPRTYLLVLLLLETGVKKAELLNPTTDSFDSST